MMNIASEMGKQLDSLADVVSFGVAPGMIIYQFLRLCFAQQEDGLDVSVLALLPAFVVPCAGAYRLARYNLDKSQYYGFKGVPIPAAGLLIASFPLIYWYSNNETINKVLLNQWFWYALVIIIAYLMVSRLPMMALKFKGFSVKKDSPKLILVAIAIIAGIFLKWLAVPVVFVVYVVLSLAMPPKQPMGEE
jgi:CDP-diacylglycerol--serine O-phosphatidyltransferase